MLSMRIRGYRLFFDARQSCEVMTIDIAYAIGLLKSHIPDLDPGLLDRSFKCATEADRDTLGESIIDVASRFVATCGFTIDPPAEDE
jgi:hypothetical protein